ncbi:S9 family peptidase [Caenimonas aquaedulcis]|uniref:S9 family peptidase n=1 Tax=Caenimonas aquaedulcis TaxID=2793270 RepID=A0A931MHY2_9BURK|nr:S9 family peptidase [Caenimonas aquaedulcis]MBG9389254.1 S9 family peptidase [Caenimonas aquaedulcis]
MTSVPYSPADHIAVRRVGGIAASPDGRWLAVAVQRLDRDGVKYLSDLWKVPTDGSAAVQLTRGETKDAAPCFRHDGALGFLSNRQPNEIKPDEDAEKRMQVWLLPAEGGEPRQLTDEPLGVEGFRFAARADRMVLFAPVLAGVAHEKQRETASERAKKGTSARNFRTQPVRHWDHWLHQNPDRANTHLIVCDAQGGQRKDLTPDATTELAIEAELDIAADGLRALTLWRVPGEDRMDDHHLMVFDLEAGTHRLLPQGGSVSTGNARFAPDGRAIAAVREKRTREHVVRPTLTLFDDAGHAREVAKTWDRWPHIWGWSADGRDLLVTADDEGIVPVFSVRASSGEVTPLTPRANGGGHNDVVALPQGGFACIRSTTLDAPECYVHDGKPGSATTPLARLSGFKPASDWAEIESITTTSTDGTAVQSWITRPKSARGGKSPVLLWIHGGPIGMSGDAWHWRWNPLLAVAQGYTVVQPNPRGSTGFGQDFIQGIWGNVWGGQCFEDIMAVTDALEARPDVDASRIMAMGGSFGGYMTNWLGTQTQRFRCLVTHASIVTMANFTGVTDHPGYWYFAMGSENPYEDPLAFDRYAPMRHIAKWKTPALVIHGEQDYRCPVGEGLMLFEALQYHGVDSELMVFPDENHWVLKPKNVVAWYENILRFVATYMK